MTGVNLLISLLVTLQRAAVSSSVIPPSASFQEYVRLLQRQYGHPSHSEYSLRRSLFESRAEAVHTHNAKSDRIWTAGLNHLSDRTADELKALRGWRGVGGDGASGSVGGSSLVAEHAWRIRAPAQSVSWTNLSVLQDVHDQGECGSCWAVATAAMLQAHREINLKKTAALSIQQLVDCVPNPKECGGQGGCKGATVELGMKWVMENGLSDDHEIPYQAIDGSCSVPGKDASSLSQRFLGNIQQHMDSGKSAAKLGLVAWNTLPSNMARPLMSALMDGPVAISVAASGWFLYDSGVFNGCEKDSVIDHAVLLVAFGSDTKSGKKSWTIRNSWGPAWGEDGHVRLLRHDTTDEDDKFCGTDNKPEDGIECKPYPEKVTVCGMCGMLYDSVAAHFDPKAAL